MNWLRFGYRCKMRTSSLVDPIDVVHYQVAHDTPMYQKVNVYGSRLWMKEPFNEGFGEQSDGRVCCGKQDVDWYNGAHPVKRSGGEIPCGTDEVARYGGGPDDPLFPTLADGSAPCCLGGFAWTNTLLMFSGPTLSSFAGKGNSIPEAAYMSIFDFDAVPDLVSGRFNFFPFNTFEYNRESAPEAVVVFTGPAEAPTSIDLDFPTVSTTTQQVVFWGNGVARFLIKFNVSGNTHQIDVIWDY